MKKLVTIMLVLVMVFGATSAFADSHNTSAMKKGDFEVKAGVDFGGNIKADILGISSEDSTKIGFSIIGEYIIPSSNNLSYGAGLEFPLGGREADVTNATSFNFIPFYGLARYNMQNNFYLTGKLGYNTFSFDNTPSDVDVNGGMYYGIGAGMKVKDNVSFELLYSVSNGSIEATSGTQTVTSDMTYSRIGLSVGTTF